MLSSSKIKTTGEAVGNIISFESTVLSIGQSISSYDSLTKNRNINPPKRLHKFLSVDEPQGVWRTLHPNTIDYTYFSHPQNTCLRKAIEQQLKLKLDSLLLKKVNDFRHNSNKLNYISANKLGKHLTSLVKKVLKRLPMSFKK